MANKYVYLKVIQQRSEWGWEDIDAHDKSRTGWFREFKENMKAYRQNQPEYEYRAVNRRELNESI